MQNRTIGLLPDAFDVLFAPLRDSGPVYLTAAGSTEAEWAKTFLPSSGIASFRLRSKGVPASTLLLDELIRGSDVLQTASRHGLRRLVTRSLPSPWANAQAAAQGVRFAGPKASLQKSLGNKISFDCFLERHKFPKPRSATLVLSSHNRHMLHFPCVLQEPRSAGGHATFFAKSAAEVEALIQQSDLSYGKRYLVREYAEGIPYGITVIISAGGVALSALRRQCFEPQNRQGVRVFRGIQWVPTKAVPPAHRRAIEKVFGDLGKVLQARAYRGGASFDFILSKQGKPCLIECNPRLSLASAQIFQHPELLHGIDLFGLICGARPDLQVSGSEHLPDSSFCGSTWIQIASTDYIEEQLTVSANRRSGGYRVRGSALYLGSDPMILHHERDAVFVVSLVRKGDLVMPWDQTWIGLSNNALFSSNGSPSLLGRKVAREFCVVHPAQR